ncbi:hypothetical protein ACWKWU_00390 [Chitinophaga lutea]
MSIGVQAQVIGDGAGTDTMIVFVPGGRCKGSVGLALPFTPEMVRVTGVVDRTPLHADTLPHFPPIRKPRLLTLHGNVTYDGYYQSNGDSTYLEKEVHQHTIQTNIEITYKERYPLRLSFSTNQGNSRLFRDFTGAGLQYSSRWLLNNILQRAKGWEAATPQQLEGLKKMKVNIDSLKAEWAKLQLPKGKRESGIQETVEARERAIYQRLRDSLASLGQTMDLPSLPALQDTGLLAKGKTMAGDVAAKLDSLQAAIRKLELQYKRKEKQWMGRKDQLLAAIEKAKNSREMLDELERLNVPDSILPKGYKTLLAIRSAGVGTTNVDYSELTAKNVRITGLQVEYNPSYYVAFASGAVDYRFRDFMNGGNRVRQYLNIARMGWGMKDGNNLILSYFIGRKQIYNFNTDSTGNAPDHTIMGLSLEGRWQLDQDNYLTAEVAKSALPYYARAGHAGNGESMVAMNDQTNTAWAVSFHSKIAKTATTFTGMFKHLGANYQSFSLYASGSAQNIWMIRAEQPLWKRQLTLVAGIRKNVYTSLMEGSMYRSNALFKSFQATFRRKRWPVLSAGYFPSVQILRMGEGKYMEQLYNTLNGTASYMFDRGAASFSTMFSVNRFFNQRADSNFVYFNSTNMMLQQTVDWRKFTLTGGVSLATNNDYKIYGAEGDVQYRIARWLRVGGGIKHARQSLPANSETGYSGNAGIQIPYIGEISLLAEKSFVPGMQRRLEPVKTGRLTYTKVF